MVSSFSTQSSNQLLKVSLLLQAIIGWACALLFSFFAVMSTLSNQYGPALVFLFFVGLGIYLILTTGSIRMNQHIITYETPMARYQIGWDEITEIQTDYARRSHLLLGNAQTKQKQFILPGSNSWVGKDKKQMLALFGEQVEARQIPVKINPVLMFTTRKNVKVSWDSPDPETYIAKSSQSALDFSRLSSQQTAFQGASSTPRTSSIDTSLPSGPSAPAQPANPIDIIIGAGGGFIVALFAAIIWAAITYATRYQITWMAIGVGLAVGIVVRTLSRSGGTAQAVVSALLSLFGCLLGNFLTVMAIVVVEKGVSISSVLFSLVLHPDLIARIMVDTFDPMDLVFYGIALFAGYKISAK